MPHPRFFNALVLLLSVGVPATAEIRLPKILSPNMVLQRNSDVLIWGWADPGASVEVSTDWLDEKKLATANDDGEWELQLPTREAGELHTITVKGDGAAEITLNNVRFGEVWLASGQSNMEMPLTKVSNAYTGIKNATTEVQSADEPDIVLFQVGNYSSDKPLDDVESGHEIYGIPPAKCEWESCSPDSIPHFSSTAYFFARALQQELKVPIGIIDSSWGGTSAEAWTPRSGLVKLEYSNDLKAASTTPQNQDQKVPTRLYNGMIHPLRKMTIKGAIWYQGEGNASRADRYHKLFTTMIEEWRKQWGYDFSFYFAQISPFDYGTLNSAFLREAQFNSNAIAKTGMAVTMDIGNLTDIHPKNKQEVGRRLALWALAKDYKKKIVCSGPLYRDSVVEGDSIRIKFDYVAEGLTTSNGEPPSHFEIAGEGRTFSLATAVIDGEDVVVSSPKVASPKAVRYAFSNKAMPNLVNSAGLPASSFRSDDWRD